jgi:cyclopropane-fatty-acyl-phospholipid synthase
MLIQTFLKSFVREGELTVIDAGGTRHVFRGERPLHRVTIRLHDRRLPWRMVIDPQMAVPEAYMDGRLTIEEGTPFEFFDLCLTNLRANSLHAGLRELRHVALLTRHFHQLNGRRQARRNVHHHYDLSSELYGLFLDSRREYSCAYFPTGDEDIEAAQRAKEQHIAAKLLLRPGQRVLDIGSGWGAMAFHLARTYGVEVTGITLSTEQRDWATARAEALGLADRCRFLVQDYREVPGTFDRIVSVGMIEHVGVGNYGTMLKRIEELLTPDGVALIHGIGRKDGPSSNHPWLRKYIFPGSYAPALSEVLPAVERAGLWTTDVEVLRMHYAYTLRRWREKFYAHWDEAKAIYDERFCRMWEVYLIGTELFFSRQDGFIFQIQLAKDRMAVPLTRDYMVDHERGVDAPRSQAQRAAE